MAVYFLYIERTSRYTGNVHLGIPVKIHSGSWSRPVGAHPPDRLSPNDRPGERCLIRKVVGSETHVTFELFGGHCTLAVYSFVH